MRPSSAPETPNTTLFAVFSAVSTVTPHFLYIYLTYAGRLTYGQEENQML